MVNQGVVSLFTEVPTDETLAMTADPSLVEPHLYPNW